MTLISQCLFYISNKKTVLHSLDETVVPAHLPKVISEERELILSLKYLIMAGNKAAKLKHQTDMLGLNAFRKHTTLSPSLRTPL